MRHLFLGYVQIHSGLENFVVEIDSQHLVILVSHGMISFSSEFNKILTSAEDMHHEACLMKISICRPNMLPLSVMMVDQDVYPGQSHRHGANEEYLIS